MNGFTVRYAWMVLAAALLLVVQACGAAPRVGAAPVPTAVASPSAEPTPTPSPSPSPTPPATKPEPAPAAPASAAPAPAAPASAAPAPVAPAPPRPTSLPVSFNSLPAGTYPVHLHSACSGSQNFHVTVVQSLSVGGGGTGSIQVPASYFGRGLCLIVYASNALSRVLTTRSI